MEEKCLRTKSNINTGKPTMLDTVDMASVWTSGQ